MTASQSTFLPFLKHPILVYRAEGPDEVRKAFERARERGIRHTRALFATKNEKENIAEIARLPDQEHELVGIVLYGENKQVDKALRGLKFHP